MSHFLQRVFYFVAFLPSGSQVLQVEKHIHRLCHEEMGHKLTLHFCVVFPYSQQCNTEHTCSCFTMEPSRLKGPKAFYSQRGDVGGHHASDAQ